MLSRFTGVYRIGFACLGLTAVVTEITALVQRHIFNPVNFFSYFTIQSNLLAVACFIFFGYRAFTRRPKTVVIPELFRGAVTLYMMMTGVIFAILLAPVENAVLTAVPWDNIVLHYIMPVAVLLDWLILPPVSRISAKASCSWLLFPAAYVAYTLLRGEHAQWYPYPFLNAHAKGYWSVLLTSAVLFVFVLLTSQIIRMLPGRLKTRSIPA